MAEKEYEIYEAGEESCGHCIFDVDNSCTGGSDNPAPDAPSCIRAAKAAGIPFMRAAFRWKDQQNG